MMSEKKMSMRQKAASLALAAAVIAADQISKAVVAAKIPLNSVGASFADGLLRIIHVRNLGVAFSLGNSLPPSVRKFLFIAAPLAVLALIAASYLRRDEFSPVQGWAVSGIIGGGLGNLIDRTFRPEGVVDFIDVKFFGIFGLERWPTFNVADSAVVVCGILLAVSILLDSVKK